VIVGLIIPTISNSIFSKKREKSWIIKKVLKSQKSPNHHFLDKTQKYSFGENELPNYQENLDYFIFRSFRMMRPFLTQSGKN